MFWHCLFVGGSTEDSMAVLARHSARFDVLQVQFDPISGKHLAVAGLRTLQVRLQPLVILKMLLNAVSSVLNAPG